ncbi:MAG: MFS transporter [Pseudonocardiales bacterium]|nr:MAG: MFS transporter [Pseudonocardiales bacterium]
MSDIDSGTLAAAVPVPAQRESAWWAPGVLLFAAAFGTNVPTPLLLVYRDRLHLSPVVMTAIFGVYAIGLAPSLLFAGPASDRFGRTRLLLPAIVLAGVASLLFLPGANSIPVLFVARLAQGLASGAAFSIGSAWLQDLVGTRHANVAARRASLALNLGFCLGPLSAGLLVQYGSHPLTSPYLLHAALVALMLAIAVTVARHGAWSAGRRGSAGASLLPRARLDAAARRVFRRTLIPTAICVYAFPSVAITVLPLALRHERHVVLFTGILAAVTLGAGALVQPVAHRLGRLRGAVGAGLGAIGYGCGAAAALLQSGALVFTAGALLGAGAGLCLNAGLILVQQLSTPATRGACNGLFYTWAYVGFAAPLLVTSFVTVHRLAVPLAVLAALALATAAWLRARLH